MQSANSEPDENNSMGTILKQYFLYVRSALIMEQEHIKVHAYGEFYMKNVIKYRIHHLHKSLCLCTRTQNNILC
jgi:hypothetical protein